MSSAPASLEMAPPRLTELAHGGGCGCKLSPAVLCELLEGQMAAGGFSSLLVGNRESDDAAVWALDGERCIVATTDFFMPVVDDPGDFGRIAATNAISDIYAMGARPLFALAILGMPLGKVDAATVRAILAGGAEAARAAGIPVAGGHSIDSAEPIYGLAVIGEIARANLKTNAGARDGDALILTKPLGVGIYSAAIKRGELAQADYADFVATTTRLNAVGMALGEQAEVHALTDVTGFGLLGHALEMARASSTVLEIGAGAAPLLPRAAEWARSGRVTSASARNWASVADGVELPAELPQWRRDLLTDPQTSGGLLVAVAPNAAEEVLHTIQAAGFAEAAVIGRVTPAAGLGRVVVTGA
jgi:selenide,water dikinase